MPWWKTGAPHRSCQAGASICRLAPQDAHLLAPPLHTPGVDAAAVGAAPARLHRERNSAALGQLALFKGSAKLAALPRWLTVQMVRFFYKADVQQKAKILRKVRVSGVCTAMPLPFL